MQISIVIGPNWTLKYHVDTVSPDPMIIILCFFHPQKHRVEIDGGGIGEVDLEELERSLAAAAVATHNNSDSES